MSTPWPKEQGHFLWCCGNPWIAYGDDRVVGFLAKAPWPTSDHPELHASVATLYRRLLNSKDVRDLGKSTTADMVELFGKYEREQECCFDCDGMGKQVSADDGEEECILCKGAGWRLVDKVRPLSWLGVIVDANLVAKMLLLVATNGVVKCLETEIDNTKFKRRCLLLDGGCWRVYANEFPT